jgi:hypothetical protein
VPLVVGQALADAHRALARLPLGVPMITAAVKISRNSS